MRTRNAGSVKHPQVREKSARIFHQILESLLHTSLFGACWDASDPKKALKPTEEGERDNCILESPCSKSKCLQSQIINHGLQCVIADQRPNCISPPALNTNTYHLNKQYSHQQQEPASKHLLNSSQTKAKMQRGLHITFPIQFFTWIYILSGSGKILYL